MSESEKVSSTVSVSVKKRNRVANDVFIPTYEACSTYQEVADKLGLKEMSVRQRAIMLIKRGVPLNKKPRKQSTVTVGKKFNQKEALEILAKVRGVSVEDLV